MNNQPFVSDNMSEPDIQSVLAIYHTLRKTYTAEFDLNFSCDLRPFASFEYDEILDSGPFIKITNRRNSFHLGFMQVGYHLRSGRYSLDNPCEFQIWSILNLAKDYGHILIKQETIMEKILDRIHPIELDFDDDKEFSRNFYVLAEDKIKARLLMTPAFRNQIMTITTPDFVFEILGNQLIMGDKKKLNLDTALGFAQFMDGFSINF